MPCTITIRSFLWTHTEYLKTPRNLPAFSQNHPTLIDAAVTARSIPCDPQLARRVTFLPEMEHTTFRTNLTSAPDFANILFELINNSKAFIHGRMFEQDDNRKYHRERELQLRLLDESTSDWDPGYEFYEEKDYPSSNDCYRPKWSYEYRPTCNKVHEDVLLDRPSGIVGHVYDFEYVGSGHFRLSYVFRDASHNMFGNFVLKAIHFAEGHDFDRFTMDTVRLEALSMERTSASDRTIDIYSHCAASVVIEPAREVFRKLRPSRFFIAQDELDRKDPDNPVPFNNLTLSEKLGLSLAMAEGLAELHGNS